jgi:hypothetical protein
MSRGTRSRPSSEHADELADVGEDVLVAYLRAHRADEAPHAGGRTLLEHLIGTRRIAHAWGQPREVVDAALFHSVYGTDVYPNRTIDPAHRDEVRALIGTRAERLVWLFATTDRHDFRERLQAHVPSQSLAVRSRSGGATIALDPPDVFALLILYMANELDQADDADGNSPSVWPMLLAMSRYLDPAYGTIPAALDDPQRH